MVKRSRDDDDFGLIDAEALARLRELDDGGDAFLLEVIELYRDAASRHLAAIDTALGNGDGDAVARHAHSLKGSASEVGAQRVERLAGELAERGTDVDAGTLIARLSEAHGETAAALQALVADSPKL